MLLPLKNGLQPGDFKYEDKNGDGIVDGKDRQALGSYIPKFTYGVNAGFVWKNLDFEVSTYGQSGAKLYNRKRALSAMLRVTTTSITTSIRIVGLPLALPIAILRLPRSSAAGTFLTSASTRSLLRVPIISAFRISLWAIPSRT
jgi:hypothetical protein